MKTTCFGLCIAHFGTDWWTVKAIFFPCVKSCFNGSDTHHFRISQSSMCFKLFWWWILTLKPALFNMGWRKCISLAINSFLSDFGVLLNREVQGRVDWEVLVLQKILFPCLFVMQSTGWSRWFMCGSDERTFFHVLYCIDNPGHE